MKLDPVRRNASIATAALVVGGLATVFAAFVRGPAERMFGDHLGRVPIVVFGVALLASGAGVMLRREWSMYVAAFAGLLLGVAGFVIAAAESTLFGYAAMLLGAVGFVTVLRGHAWFRGLEHPVLFARTREPLRAHHDYLAA